MIVRLIFLSWILAQSPVCFAEADGPDAWQVYGLGEGSQLNMRTGPSTEFEVVAKLSADARNLENMGCFPEFSGAEWQRFNQRERQLAVDMRWCKVRHEGTTGWVYGKYLEEY